MSFKYAVEEPRDHAQHFADCLEAAGRGIPEAQNDLGVMYITGDGVEEDEGKGERWLEIAASAGLPVAQYNLEMIYFPLVIPDKDGDMHLRKAAENGFPDAQFFLGIRFSKGWGVYEDHVEAAYWFRLAAKQGSPEAQLHLGMHYFHDLGFGSNYKAAVKWLQLAADQGLAEAQNNLAGMYYRGYGVKKSEGKAIKWLRLAAEQELAEAQYNLGEMYLFGYGVKKDYTEGLRRIRFAADHGCFKAEFNLGIIYEIGLGVTQDYKEAAKRYRSAEDMRTDPETRISYHVTRIFMSDVYSMCPREGNRLD